MGIGHIRAMVEWHPLWRKKPLTYCPEMVDHYMSRSFSENRKLLDMMHVASASKMFDLLEQAASTTRIMDAFSHSFKHLSVNEILTETASDFSEDDIDGVLSEEAREETLSAIEQISELVVEGQDNQAIRAILSKLSVKFKIIIVIFIFAACFVKDVVRDVAVEIAVDLLKPIVLEKIEDYFGSTDREKINAIKNIPKDKSKKTKDINTNGIRFITRDETLLRKKPSVSSAILDEVELGQIVKILSKRRNWIEIEYHHESGEIMTGWVFTRYTKRFVNNLYRE